MAWTVEFEDGARKDLAKLDKPTAKRITAFLRERVVALGDPRLIGEALKGSRLGEYWKYRVGDYRIICYIEDNRLCVLVVTIPNSGSNARRASRTFRACKLSHLARSGGTLCSGSISLSKVRIPRWVRALRLT